MDNGTNAFAELEDFGDGVHGRRMLEREPDSRLRSAVWELDPGATQGPYHVHHGTEELLVVLRGRPTLRTPDGERQLEAGDVVHFPAGPTGAHQLRNDGDEVARYVIAASHAVPDIVEYVDDRVAMAWSIHDSLATGKRMEIKQDLE